MARDRSTDLTLVHSTPDLNLLRADFHESVNSSAHLVQYQAQCFNTRFAYWNHQSADGRKHEGENGEEPLPWKRASDVRIFEADAVVNEQVRVMMGAWHRGAITLSATQMVNQMAGVKAQQLLRWMFRVHLRTELAHEVQRYCQWRQTFGYALMGVFWEQQRRFEPMEFDLFSLADALGIPPEGPERLAFKEAMMDPLRAPALEAAFLQQFPDLTPGMARKAVADFRSGAVCVIPRVEVTRSMPMWQAQRPFVDVVHRVGARSIQKCPRIYQREWLTEDELQDRAELYDYDPQWVDMAIEQKGAAGAQYGDVAQYMAGLSPARRDNFGWMYGDRADTKDLIEIVHCYGLGVDPRTRAPMRFCTTFHPNVPEKWGSHGAHAYQHGKAPYVAGVRELVDPAMTEARGVPDIVRHDQSVIKDEVDGRRDAGQMSLLPPLLKPMRRARERIKLGPAAQIAELNAGEHRFMDLRSNPNPSLEVEQAARERVDRYFGRIGSSADPALQMLHNQGLVDEVTTEFSEMATQTLQLAQQYMEPIQAEMVVAGVSQVLFAGSRKEIQGQFTVMLSYSVELDPEKTMEKFRGVIELLKLDRYGAADSTGIMQLGISMIDPSIGEYYIRPQEQATEGELREEDDALAKILAGIEPPPPPENANAQLRLQRLQERLLANPMLATPGANGVPTWGPLLAQRVDVQAMLEARFKQLSFITTQRENAIIGRQGAGPGLEKLREGSSAQV